MKFNYDMSINCPYIINRGGEGVKTVIFKKFGQLIFVGRPTDRQTDIVVHREVTLPKITSPYN